MRVLKASPRMLTSSSGLTVVNNQHECTLQDDKSRDRTGRVKVIGTNGVALTFRGPSLQQRFSSSFLLCLHAILPLQPRLRRLVLVRLLVFVKLREELSDARDVRSLSISGWMI